MPKRTGEDPLVRRLAKLADSCGMWARHVVVFPTRLAEIGLDREDLTRDTIQKADALIRQWDAEVRTRVDAYNEKILARQRKRGFDPTVRDESVREMSERGPKKKRTTLFDQSITALLRWMGAEGWKHDDAVGVLKHYGITMAKATVKIQMYDGRTGKGKDPASITPSQERELYQILKKL